MNYTEKLAASLDVKHYKDAMKLLCIGFIPGIFAILASLLSFDVFKVICPAMLITYAILYLPVLGYYRRQIKAICADPQQYAEYEAKAVQMQASFGRKLYLVLEVRREDGSVFSIDTKAIFSASIMSAYYFGEYFNQPLSILYDDAQGRVVVLGKK